MKLKTYRFKAIFRASIVPLLLFIVPALAFGQGDGNLICDPSVFIKTNEFLEPIDSGPFYWFDDVTFNLRQTGDRAYSWFSYYNHADSPLFNLFDPEDDWYCHFGHEYDLETRDYIFYIGVSVVK